MNAGNPNVSAEGLNQILMIHDLASGLPTEQAILDCVCSGLDDIPGVAVAHVDGNNEGGAADASPAKHQHRFPIQIQGKVFSEIVLETDDPDLFEPYIPYINNLCFSIAVLLEEKHLRQENSEYREKLESRVRERTAQLSKQIHEKEVAEKNALDEKKRAERYLDVVQAITVELDLNGNIKIINQWGADRFGAKPDELVGRNWFDLALPERVREEIRSLYFQFLAGEQPEFRKHDNSIVAYNGQEYEVAWHNALVLNVDGSTSGSISFGIDITERIRFEEKLGRELRVNEELAALGSVLIAPGMDIREVASRVLESARRLTGSEQGFVSEIDRESGGNICHTLTEMMGKDCTVTGSDQKILFPCNQDGQYPALWGHGINSQEAFVTNSPQDHPQSSGLPAGHIPVEQFMSVPVKYRNEVVGQIALANAPQAYDQRDVDAVQRLANLYALSINRHWTRQDRMRMEQQLHQAQRVESVGRLAGGVAHDYNNMLNVIMGHAEMALMKLGPTEAVRENLNQIMSAAKRSRDITRQLLAFARKQIIEPQVLDFNAAIEGTLKMLHQLLGENIDLSWHPGEGLWPLEMDPSQLDQILANLCINARDAITDVGKITIETDKASLDQDYCRNNPGFLPGEFVSLTVSDDGCGMDSDLLGNIFEPFFTTKQTGEGSGLGLSTVYGSVKQCGGFIKVYSEPGIGSTFKIYFPRFVGDIPAKEEAVNIELAKGKGETVLVVEDEPAILNLTTTILEDLKYQPLAANSPSEALTVAEKLSKPIDLLVTDVVMPEMNGRELAKRMQVIHPGIKVLYMSGYTDNAIAHHGVLDKGVNFIQKPFSTNDFSFHLREALD